MATGGSFHGWKFLPVIGKYVVRMLEGSLGKTLAARWAWDGAGSSTIRREANPTYHIEGDLQRLKDEWRREISNGGARMNAESRSG